MWKRVWHPLFGTMNAYVRYDQDRFGPRKPGQVWAEFSDDAPPRLAWLVLDTDDFPSEWGDTGEEPSEGEFSHDDLPDEQDEEYEED